MRSELKEVVADAIASGGLQSNTAGTQAGGSCEAAGGAAAAAATGSRAFAGLQSSTTKGKEKKPVQGFRAWGTLSEFAVWYGQVGHFCCGPARWPAARELCSCDMSCVHMS